MPERKRLGEIFVEQGIITERTVERMLRRSVVLNRRFGTVLEELELVTGEELADALAVQYGYKVVSNLLSHRYSPEIFQLIPVEVAMQHFLFPLRREQEKLALAMADPTDTRVVGNIAANHGLTIVPFIATIKEIHGAICKYYLGREPLADSERTVLVAADDKVSLESLSGILSRNGYNVVRATDGMDAFKVAISERPHVVITDRLMPKLDGYGLFEALQNVPETMFIPVILISGVMEEDEEARAFEKGFFDFIAKPVRDVTLLVRVKRAFSFYEHHYRLR